MTHLRVIRRAAAGAILAVMIAAAAQAESADALRRRLAAASSSITDLRGTMVVAPASRSSAAEINKGVLRFLDQGFREATIYYKRPDRFRAEGKGKGGIYITYVLSGNTKQIIAPALMLKKTDDMSHDRDQKQSTLDVGFASDGLWLDNRVTVVSERKGEIELRLVPIGTTDKRKELVWLDSRTLKVLRRERYGGTGLLKARYVYTNHRTMGKMPVATLVKAYASDGGYAGAISYKNVRVNTRVSDALFAIK